MFGIDPEGALLKAPKSPGAHTVVHLAVFALDGHGARQFQQIPKFVDPRASADDNIVALDGALVGLNCSDGERVIAEIEPVTSQPVMMRTPSASALDAKP